MYSCALWGDEEGGIDGDLLSGPTPNDLETAQLRKIHHVLNKARVRPGHRILEFGSGWGGLAIEVCISVVCAPYHSHINTTNQAARTYGCSVDSLTLSIEQKTLAEQRVKAAGLDHLVRIHLMDYRDIPSHFEHAFDAFVSIEMLEHVGSHVSTICRLNFEKMLNLMLSYSTTNNISSWWIMLSKPTMRLLSSALPRSRNAVTRDTSMLPLMSAPSPLLMISTR